MVIQPLLLLHPDELNPLPSSLFPTSAGDVSVLRSFQAPAASLAQLTVVFTESTEALTCSLVCTPLVQVMS
jgi:hypothetical protein